jgi:hypothetical protein
MAAARSSSGGASAGSTKGSTSGACITRRSKKGSGSRAKSRGIGRRSIVMCRADRSETFAQSRPESGSLHSAA